MPRTLQITVPSERTETILAEVTRLEGLLGLSVQRGASLKPPGDIISVEITSRDLHELMQLLERREVLTDPSSSLLTSQPLSVISPRRQGEISGDTSEATWEEMELTIARSSNMTVNGLWTMAAAGMIAALGILTDVLHLVIGAMVIAPGFEPISRVGLGLIGGGGVWRRGVLDTAKAYLTLIAAAFLITLLFRIGAPESLRGGIPYLSEGILKPHWLPITLPSAVVTVVASFAGALLVAANRALLTAGVMIALALVPSATLIGMGLAEWDLALAGRALLRWLFEVAGVLLLSLAVFSWKRSSVQKRRMHA
jgi:uncharacterized membrane protein